MLTPFTSVIIPTCNDDLRLEWLLEGLCRQSYTNFEVIVSNDKGPMSTKNLVNKFQNRLNIHHVYFDKPKTPGREQRAAATRNFGVKHSKGELLAFLDSDCVPDSDWLESHASQSYEDISFYGFRRLFPEELVKSFNNDFDYNYFKKHSLIDTRLEQYGKWENPILYKHYFGCSFSVYAKVYCELGGMDERFEGWGEEDIHEGWKYATNGIEIIPLWGKGFVTHLGHPKRPRPEDLYKRKWRENPEEPLPSNGKVLLRL